MALQHNTIVNRVSKTKREVDDYPHQEEREKRDRAERNAINEAKKKQEAEAKVLREQRAKEKDARSYDHLMKEDAMVSNAMLKKMSAEEYEDDFM